MSWIGIIGLSVALGLRHGLDWDHIAALTDITSGSPGTKNSASIFHFGMRLVTRRLCFY